MKTRQKNCLAHFSVLRSKRFIFYSFLLRSLVVCVTALALAQAQDQPPPAGGPPPDTLDYNAPWTGDKVIQPNRNYQQAMDAARGALDRKDYPKAIAEANRALKFKPQDPEAVKLKGEAERLRSQALSQTEHDRGYRRAMSAAHAAFNRGDYPKAMAESDRALALRPDDADAQELKANIARQRGESVAPVSPVTAPPAAVAPAEPAPVIVSAPPAGAPPSVTADAATGSRLPAPPPPNLKPPKPARNEISVSGDYFLGQGTVTLPFGFAFGKASPQANFGAGVISAKRNSDYFGGTLSYSFGQAWYLDLSYEHGSSSGNAALPTSLAPNLGSSFTINDTWYQAYFRYTFPRLRGTRLTAYLRAGGSYVSADLTEEAPISGGIYNEKDQTKDFLGNLGFGVGYSFYRSSRVKLALQAEGEGFYGNRSQNIEESVTSFNPPSASTSINNNLYGGIGRGTLRFEYAMGHSGLFKAFAEGGIQGKFSEISYSHAPGTSFNGGSSSEILWGPYVKLGLRYAF
jgi:hypothetical protein